MKLKKEIGWISGAMMAPMTASLIVSMASSLVQPAVISLTNAKRSHENRKRKKIRISSIISIIFDDETLVREVRRVRRKYSNINYIDKDS